MHVKVVWLQIFAVAFILISVLAADQTGDVGPTCGNDCTVSTVYETYTTSYMTTRTHTVTYNITTCNDPCPSVCTDKVITTLIPTVTETTSLDCWSGCATRPIYDTMTTTYVSYGVLTTQTVYKLRTYDPCHGGCVVDTITSTSTITSEYTSKCSECSDQVITTVVPTELLYSTVYCWSGCATMPIYDLKTTTYTTDSLLTTEYYSVLRTTDLCDGGCYTYSATETSSISTTYTSTCPSVPPWHDTCTTLTTTTEYSSVFTSRYCLTSCKPDRTIVDYDWPQHGRPKTSCKKCKPGCTTEYISITYTEPLTYTTCYWGTT